VGGDSEVFDRSQIFQKNDFSIRFFVRQRSFQRSCTYPIEGMGTQHFLSIRKLKRDRDHVLNRSTLVAIRSYLTVYDRDPPATNSRRLIECSVPDRVQCPRVRFREVGQCPQTHFQKKLPLSAINWDDPSLRPKERACRRFSVAFSHTV
jgi:hypothetical protein